MDVLSLLRSKNRCLEKFLAISREYLDAGAAFENLGIFETRRDATLKAIELYDRKLAESISLIAAADRTPEMIEGVKRELDRKEQLVHEILDLDLRIIGKIEEEKNRLLQQVANARKGKEVLSRFKSTWVSESGEELDETL